jgi:hypothetical protein
MKKKALKYLKKMLSLEAVGKKGTYDDVEDLFQALLAETRANK